MANVQNLLNAAKKQKENKNTNTQSSPQNKIVENQFISNDLSSLEQLYFGTNDNTNNSDGIYESYPNGQVHKVYDPEEDMKEMASFDFSNTNSKMPKAILESMMNNPLNIPTPGTQSEIMDEGLQNRTLDIINKLDNRDKKGIIGNTQNHQQPIREEVTYSNEYSDIVNIIEKTIDEKLLKYTKAIINESRKNTTNQPSLSFMKLGNTFTFMDSDNNVYECKMVYKGKGKVRSKK